MKDQLLAGLQYKDGSEWKAVSRFSLPALNLADLRTKVIFFRFLELGYILEWKASEYRIVKGDRSNV